MRILCIEDAQEIALLLQLVLRDEGHDVDCWTSDFRAIAELAPWEQIDTVICDQQLADYDGKDLFRWLHKAHPSIHRVMITGSHLTTEEEAHADLVLIKPFSTEAVLTAVQSTS